MERDRLVPSDPLSFIRDGVSARRVLWTYHVNMRMRRRSISREQILQAVSTYEILEAYPDDKYLPSYLVFAQHEDVRFPVLFATDTLARNVRVITAYVPSPERWNSDFKTRRTR
jgi:uncharacterized protein DUF4258